jgi:OOP family OmpA-OmpF porin
MNLRSTLLAATILALPVVANAQNAPIAGVYLGGAVGANFMQQENESITINQYSQSGKLNFNPGFAGKINVGYGFGNGFRAELEGNYRYNSVSGTNALPVAGTLAGHGNEQKMGAMINGLYDFNTLSPYVVPYVGVGVGYQAVQWQNVSAYGSNGSANFGTSTKSSFAYQAIVGAAFPITPALAITAEYNFMGLASDRNYSGTANLHNTANTVSTSGNIRAKANDDYNHTLLIGIRYAFGVTPPPVPVAAPAPAPAPARSYLVFFDWDKANLTDRARQIIRDAAENSKKVSYTKIETNGYTDTSGTPKYNQGLSVRRAQAVAAELVRDGVPKNAIAITGFGETHPLVPTGPNVREPQNRRVEIIIR